jgi:hypothetical protein
MAAPTTCLSSQMMSDLLTWRNPRGVEENWYYDLDSRAQELSWADIGKEVVTELGVALIALAACVESVVFIALATLSMVLVPCTEAPFEFSLKVIDSSIFTILWALGTLCNNFIYPNLITHESLARHKLFSDSFGCVDFYRPEDAAFREEWRVAQGRVQLDHLDEDEVVSVAELQAAVNRVAQLIKDDVLAGVEQSTKDLVMEADGEAMHFVATKSIYLYAAGSKRDEKIPAVFQANTRAKIESYRKQYPEGLSKENQTALDQAMRDLIPFQQGPNGAVKQIYDDLREPVWKEMQWNNGVAWFIRECYPRAVKLLEAEQR